MSDKITLPKRSKPTNIGVIIQARMTSKRFPGKSMALLAGKPVLQRVLERAKLIGPTLKVILAVPDTEASEPMLELADKYKVDNFCGSENDVLDRYYSAARFFKLNVIMRITADCPFIDPIVCREVLDLLIWRKQDYTSNIHPVRTYPQGLDCECFTFDCLEAANIVTLDPYDREHVTPWMQRTKGIRKAQVQQYIDQSHKNWCVDLPEDIKRIEALIQNPGSDNEKLN